MLLLDPVFMFQDGVGRPMAACGGASSPQDAGTGLIDRQPVNPGSPAGLGSYGKHTAVASPGA